MTTPALELATTFVFDERGRIVSTREPRATHGPLFVIVRSAEACAWAVRDDVPSDVADAIAALASAEPVTPDLRMPPVHAEEYLALSGGRLGFRGPAFSFPEPLPEAEGIVLVEDEAALSRHFSGFAPGEIAAGRGPMLAVLEQGHPVSICFCARRAEGAAAAGLETAEPYRGRGHGPRVTAAWARAVRETGRVPLYSAAWTNAASLAVARKLRLVPHASFWSVVDEES